MASSRKIFHPKQSYSYPTPSLDPSAIENHQLLFDFDEADLWKSSNDHHHSTDSSTTELSRIKPIPSSRSSKKHLTNMHVASTSLPVNIPDWSKILKEEYREHGKRESDVREDGDYYDYSSKQNDDEYYSRVPPHEYLAMTRGASFSVHEGIGRTLKGRDLRRVRNAILKKVGFEDEYEG